MHFSSPRFPVGSGATKALPGLTYSTLAAPAVETPTSMTQLRKTADLIHEEALLAQCALLSGLGL